MSYDRVLNEFLHALDSPHDTLTSSRFQTNLPWKIITSPDWPPSILEAAEHIQYAPWLDSALCKDEASKAAPLSESLYPRVTATPLSFYGRSLELRFPGLRHGSDLLLSDPISSALPNKRPDQAIYEVDEGLSFVESDYSSSSGTSRSRWVTRSLQQNDTSC